jgi:diacylglycerol O-acyltransferase / wax synthase
LFHSRAGAYGHAVAKPTGLTALESSFLAVERPGLPMHVAGVVVFEASERPVTIKELRRLITARLSQLPRYGQRARTRWSGLLRSEWVDVADLDVDAHLFHHRLRSPGGTARLNELCARIHEEPLPRDRPLWQIHLVDGLAGGRQALVVKTHHAITDGIAGIKIAGVLFDRAGAAGGGHASPHFAASAGPSMLGLAQAALGLAFTAAGGPIALPSRLNGAVGAHRAFGHTAVPMELVRALKRRFGGSVDDVLVALVAAGLARELAGDGTARPPALRAMLPVSTRPPVDGSELGNHVSAVFVDLPLDTTDLEVLVRRIATSKSVLRGAHAAAGMSMLIEVAGWLPHPMHQAAVRFASSLPMANLVLSDVPGPDEALFFFGRRIVACYPMIPLPAAVGLSIAAVSMGGQMGIGIVSDPRLLPKPQQLASEIDAAVKAALRPHRSSRPRKVVQPARRRAA